MSAASAPLAPGGRNPDPPRAPRGFEGPARGQRDRLGAAPGPDEGERLDVLPDQPPEQVGRLRGGGAAQPGARLAAGFGQRRFPQREGQRPARRAVLGNLLGVQAGQQPGAVTRRPHRGRGEHEHRPRPAVAVSGSVMRHHPAQPPQHVRHVRAEHSPVSVALVHHHVAQPAEKPGPAVVPWQQRPVQHVGRGEQVPCVAARPVPFGPGRIAVEDGRLHPRQAERADRAELIGGQRLGRRHVEHGVARQHRGERGQQVPEGLAGRRRGGDDHVPAGPRVVRGQRLMTPWRADAAVREGTGHRRRHPRRPRHLLAGPRRDVLDVHGPARPGVAEQDAQGAVPGPVRGGIRRNGRGHNRAGRGKSRGKGSQGRHSLISVTSRSPMIGDFPCVAPPRGAGRHDFV